MSEVLLKIDIPKDWKNFTMPDALKKRLNDLLDRQDREEKITPAERREAEALVELSEMLLLMKLRAEQAAGQMTA